MLLRYPPLIAGLLPIVAIHLSLLIAIDAGAIQGCNPYFEGCTSISATGRYVPASYLFRPAMMAVVLADSDPVENVIEWIFALLMHCYFVLTFFAWRNTGFHASYVIRSH